MSYNLTVQLLGCNNRTYASNTKKTVFKCVIVSESTWDTLGYCTYCEPIFNSNEI